MTWHEEDHHRDGQGQFSRMHVDAWVKKVAQEWGSAFNRESPLEASQMVGHPAGHAEAKARLEHLWKIGDRQRGVERTDAQQAELDRLEGAFDTYRNELGLSRRTDRDVERLELYKDKHGATYDRYGEFITGGPVTDRAPLAAQLGYTRVGDHPEGVGKVDGGSGSYMTPSLHPQAGGLWINPKQPGTPHAPNYRNDLGHGVSGLRPKEQASHRHKNQRLAKRSGQLRTRPQEAEGTWFQHWSMENPLKMGVQAEGEFGYGARSDAHNETSVERAKVFVAQMRRAQPRARQETGRQAVRRTPRGTPIEGWMRA